MAKPALRICNSPGCRQRVRATYCEKHHKERRRERPNHKAKTTERGYGWDWQKLRRAALQRDDYLCQDCLENGRTTAAVEVHHREKISEEPQLRLDLDNLMSLCGECHQRRSARGE